MKLIIDINKEDYEYIRENKGMHYTMTTGICEAIFDGTPLEEELEKIKAEVQFIAEKCLPNNLAEEFEVKGLKTSIEIIDRRISKLKG